MKQIDSDEETKNINSVSSQRKISNSELIPSVGLYRPEIKLKSKKISPTDSQTEQTRSVSNKKTYEKPEIITSIP